MGGFEFRKSYRICAMSRSLLFEGRWLKIVADAIHVFGWIDFPGSTHRAGLDVVCLSLT